MLTSQQPVWIGWGKDLCYLYNDPYKSIIGGKHPWALGRPAAVTGTAPPTLPFWVSEVAAGTR